MEEIKQMLVWSSVVCLVFAVLWMFRFGKDRARGAVMGMAFLFLGGTMYGYASGWSQFAVIAMMTVVVLLLVVDVLVRSARKVEGN